MHLPMSIYPSCNGPRILKVKGYMEMRSTCNLVDVQTADARDLYIYMDRHLDAHHNEYVNHSLS